jgi:O-antigen/teichoic acid export membrane protein
VVQVLALAGSCMSILSVAGMMPQALGRWDLTLGTRALATVLIVGAIFSVREAGLVAIAAAVAAGEAMMILVSFYVVRRLTAEPISKQALAYAPIASAALVMAAAVFGWRQLMVDELEGMTLLASSVLLGAAVYAAALLVMAFPLVHQAWELLSSVRQGGRVVLAGPTPAESSDPAG